MAIPESLTVGVVQLKQGVDAHSSAEKIAGFVREAKERGCRLVIFPEDGLYSTPEETKAEIDSAVEEVRTSAAANQIHVIFSVLYKLADAEKLYNRLYVFGPAGETIQIYDKIYGDPRFPNVPGPFEIDGIACCAILCADRWLRGVEELPVFAGAQIIIECSSNFDNEWVPDLEWFWYVPRAIRNGAFVIFSNTPRERMTTIGWPGHGHSAIIAPDGTLLAAARGEPDHLLVAELDIRKADRAEATRRQTHPLFRHYWETGVKIMCGAAEYSGAAEHSGERHSYGMPAALPDVQLFESVKKNVTVAAAQIACSQDIQENLAAIDRMLAKASAMEADLVCFPELAVTGGDERDILAAGRLELNAVLGRLQKSVRKQGVCAVVGMPWVEENGERYNSAFVIDPAGKVLTRYDQIVVERPRLFKPGCSTRAMWFGVNTERNGGVDAQRDDVSGVPGVVTIGRDALWSELAELASVRGAQIHVNIWNDLTPGRANLLRKQLWVNLASYMTLTATVNAANPGMGTGVGVPMGGGGSVIWEDFDRAHARGSAGAYPYSAVRLTEAGMTEQLLIASYHVPRTNGHFAKMTRSDMNPQMKAWYLAGAEAIYNEMQSGPGALAV